MQEVGLAFALISAFMLGSNKLPIRMALFDLDESLATVISVLPAIAMFGTPLLFYSVIKLPSLQAFLVLALAGILNNGIGRYFVWKSISTIGANRGNILGSTQFVYAIIIAVLFLGQKLDVYSGAGSLLVLSGIFLLAKGTSDGSFFSAKQIRKGIFYGVLGAFMWGLAQVAMQVGILQYKDPIMDSFITLSASLIVTIPIMLVTRGRSERPIKLERKSLFLIILAATLGGLAVFFRYTALAIIPLTIVSTVNATNPIITLVLSYIFIRNVEFINKKTVVAIIVSALGVALMSF
ncbi:MAG: DMT family transporter [Nitrososphaerota archaeon]|nr:DMT family transporter [Nitrososphaerota archaeon]